MELNSKKKMKVLKIRKLVCVSKTLFSSTQSLQNPHNSNSTLHSSREVSTAAQPRNAEVCLSLEFRVKRSSCLSSKPHSYCMIWQEQLILRHFCLYFFIFLTLFRTWIGKKSDFQWGLQKDFKTTSEESSQIIPQNDQF